MMKHIGENLAEGQIARCLSMISRQSICMRFCSMISVNKITDLSIDFGFNYEI